MEATRAQWLVAAQEDEAAAAAEHLAALADARAAAQRLAGICGTTRWQLARGNGGTIIRLGGRAVARAVAPTRGAAVSGNRTPCLQEFCSSPGWTRTNNPPVNSRMLCQLSYRGSLGAGEV